MPIKSVPFAMDPGPISPEVEALIQDADERAQAFIERTSDDPVFAFVPSDLRQVFRALRAILRLKLAPGRWFLEWGSGVGGVTLLAARLGWVAHGIEIVPELVKEAREIAKDHAVRGANFAVGSFLPQGSDDLADFTTEFAWLETSGPDGYDALDLAPDEIDLFFCYPWPGEQGVVLDLFDRHAAVGALLLTFDATEGPLLFRKVPA